MADDSGSKRTFWIRIAVGSVGLSIGLITAVVFACMQSFHKAQTDPYRKVPLQSFSAYLAASFDPSKQKALINAVTKMTAYHHSKKYTPEQLASAEQDLREAVAMFTKVLGRDNQYVAITYKTLGNCCEAEKKYVEAADAYRNAVEIDEHLCGKENETTARAINELADMQKALGKHAEATALYQRSYAIHSKYADKNSLTLAYAAESLGSSLARQNKFHEAELPYKEALGIHMARNTKESSDLSRTYQWLGWLESKQGQIAQCAEYYQESIEIETRRGDFEMQADLHRTLGIALARAKQFEKALTELDRSEQCAHKAKKIDDASLLKDIARWKSYSEKHAALEPKAKSVPSI